MIRALFCLAFLAGCGGTTINVTPDHMVDCENADRRIKELGCAERFAVAGPDEIQNTADDVSWVDYCVAVDDSGLIIINTDCIVQSITCDEIEGCFD